MVIQLAVRHVTSIEGRAAGVNQLGGHVGVLR
jgi:hypothetical protein